MIFGSKTGYGKVDLILQPSHLQVCNEIDVKAPAKKISTSQPSLASPRAIEPSPIRYDALKPRASAKSRRDRWPVYPTRRPRRRSGDYPCDGSGRAGP